MPKLLSVNNISSAAYSLLPPGNDFTFQCATPTEICRCVRVNGCDAALLPAACLEGAAKDYEPIGAYGIACRGAVGSVLLFCDLPLSIIADEKLPVFISEHSQTSRMLFHYLFHQEFGLPPIVTSDATGAFAHLYIGNDALNCAQAENPHAEVIDLCEWWFRETRLPGVFARWVVRTAASPEAKGAIEEWLEETTLFAATESGKRQMALNFEDAFSSMSNAQTYYNRLRYRLGHDELAGLEHFRMVNQESTV